MENKSTATEQQAALHKTDCYTALELLAQMMREENEAAATTPSFHKSEIHYGNAYDIDNVMKLIRKRQANDV